MVRRRGETAPATGADLRIVAATARGHGLDPSDEVIVG
jgi:hypothetical protein